MEWNFGGSIYERSNKAINTFKKVVDDLTKVNDDITVDVVKKEEKVEKLALEVDQLVRQKGANEKIIKNVDLDILAAFIFHPIMALSNPRICQNFEVSDDNIETAFTLAWDAIKF